MIILDFLFYSVYTAVPDKAFFGKRYGVMFLFTFFLSLFICALIIVINEYWIDIRDYLNTTIFFYVVIVCVALLTWFYYFRAMKIRYLHRKFSNVPKWLLKTTGYLYPLLCFVLFAAMLIYIRVNPNPLR
jgi:hypothetical protein